MDAENPVTLRCLGCGAGKTAIYDDEASSSWALTMNGKAFFLADLGIGVCRSAMQHLGEIPCTIFISHNHSDHAGELPVVLAVEGVQRKRRMQVLAAPEVLSRLQTYRMHELESSGLHLDQLATWTPTPEEETLQVDTQVGLLKLTSFRSRHSETCFGARLEIGELCIGWTADSGYAPRLMDALSVKCQLLIVDARKDGSAEHASFQDIVEYVSSRPQMDFLGVRPEESLCHVVVIGYGAQSEAPTPEDLPSSAVLRPGDEMLGDVRRVTCA
ncbi:unnamed protein product [Durusdinium trenchii]|uniref:Metallo-beta-lactamase domain-containing protein n=1 Tax=Durusdinium trenchii TaxID=1381693 RepID=A0ABP0HEW1_9DINO